MTAYLVKRPPLPDPPSKTGDDEKKGS